MAHHSHHHFQKPADDPRDHCADELNGQELARIKLSQEAQTVASRQAVGEPTPLTPQRGYSDAQITSTPLPPPQSEGQYRSSPYQRTPGYEPTQTYSYPPPGGYPQTYASQAYEGPPRPHHAHIPFPIEIGRDPEHPNSFRVGLNLFGLAKVGLDVGGHTGPYVGSDVLGSRVGVGLDAGSQGIGASTDWRVLNGAVTRGDAGVLLGANQDGLDVSGGADAYALGDNVGAGGNGGFSLGRRTGPHAIGYANVGPIGGRAGGDAYLSPSGFRADGGGNAGIDQVTGLQGNGTFALGETNEAHGDVAANAGGYGGGVGAGFYPQFAPNVYARGYSPNQQGALELQPTPPYDTPDYNEGS